MLPVPTVAGSRSGIRSSAMPSGTGGGSASASNPRPSTAPAATTTSAASGDKSTRKDSIRKPVQYAPLEATQSTGRQRLSQRATSPKYSFPQQGSRPVRFRRQRSHHEAPIQRASEEVTQSSGKQHLSQRPTSPSFTFFGAYGPELNARPPHTPQHPYLPGLDFTHKVSDKFCSQNPQPMAWRWHSGSYLNPQEEERREKFQAPRIKPGYEYNVIGYQGKYEGKAHFAMDMAPRFKERSKQPAAKGNTPGPGEYEYGERTVTYAKKDFKLRYSTLGRSKLDSKHASAPTPAFPPPGFHPRRKCKTPEIVTSAKEWRTHPDRWTRPVRTAWSEGYDAYDENFWGY